MEQYQNDLNNEGIDNYLIKKTPGTTQELKDLLYEYYINNKIYGALLIGNFPVIWYEMFCFGRKEYFPCDLYYMDFNAEWFDADNNKIFDSHSNLELEIYTSRIIGTADELNNYFQKNHAYKNGNMNTTDIAFIFKDDDWSNYNKGDYYLLNHIYKSIKLSDDISYTSKINYINQMKNIGAQYVFQWIHSTPSSLYVAEQGNYNRVTLPEIEYNNLKGIFYNLYDCSASRFTENNLAMSYLMKTDYALATLGSTKIGGNFFPYLFNSVLSDKGTWGDAFKFWYNNYACKNDSWFLGMMILGDPSLTLSFPKREYSLFDITSKGPPSTNEMENLEKIFYDFDY